MNNSRKLAQNLRAGESLSFCDSILVYQDGAFQESRMGYSTNMESHELYTTKVSWKKVKRWLKSGAYH